MRLLLRSIALAVAASFSLSATAQEWTAETVVDDLDYPWTIEAVGDVVWLTEKAGNVTRVAGGKVERYPLRTSTPVESRNGGGLLGMALEGDFEVSGTGYLYYTYAGSNGPLNRVVQASFDGDTWRETKVLLDAIPGHRLYNGGRVAIGPDGHLYVTTGWTEDPDLPQSPDSLAGKILRIAVDGSMPGDNPLPGSPIYSLGHRNPQGLAWSPAGDLYSSEHGQSALDEINRIEAGGNYGWPVVSGDRSEPGMETPFLHSGSSTWAPSGIDFYGERLLVATLRGEGLYEARNGQLAAIYAEGDRIRDVEVAGDVIYIVTTNRSPRAEGPSSDRLIRLTLSR